MKFIIKKLKWELVNQILCSCLHSIMAIPNQDQLLIVAITNISLALLILSLLLSHVNDAFINYLCLGE